jgi:hypothetical protein
MFKKFKTCKTYHNFYKNDKGKFQNVVFQMNAIYSHAQVNFLNLHLKLDCNINHYGYFNLSSR